MTARNHAAGNGQPMRTPVATRQRPPTATRSVLAINGGSSSIRFAVFGTSAPARRPLDGKIDRIGLAGTALAAANPAGSQPISRRLEAKDHRTAAAFLLDWLEEQGSWRRSWPWGIGWCTA